MPSTEKPSDLQIKAKIRSIAGTDAELAESPAFQLGVCLQLLLDAQDLLGRWRDAIEPDERRELDYLTEEHFRRFLP